MNNPRPNLVYGGYLLISPYLCLYQYPKELDYHEDIEIPKHMVRVDAFCRFEADKYELPEGFKSKMSTNDKLIYVSLGSMGSTSVKLMNKLLRALNKTNHFYVVSCGPFKDELELGERMIGDVFLPQTKVLPLVDLFVTHGGNNSVTESIHFGVPMVVLPLFVDQFDNGQRVEEKGLGVRLDAYKFTDNDLIAAIDRVLGDQEIKAKLTAARERIQKEQSKLNACLELEKLAAKGK